MKYLLDTHSLIWYLSGDARLSDHAFHLMENEENELFVSIASLWEMAIKFSIGKLNLDRPFEELFPEQLASNSIELLGITIEHLKIVGGLPFHHRDPFDRLLIAQALIESLPIIGMDEAFDRYGIQREW
ncbi:MAG: type II toxin-antitoxin system VapC family toxin [Candidatus Competibacter sp.]|nr:type II toxin-antitoxin system VapC family toxin [Candidatus Competibacteraceae bacterium]